eukprot:m.90353 g.90353  ORF g.90353 m.90353 type:complete len:283 (-) comp20122_c0_seq1:354-1202(-)
MSLRDLEKLQKLQAKAFDTQAEAKRNGKAAAGPAVPALVPTAETTVDEGDIDDIIEGEGTASDRLTLKHAHHEVRVYLKKMPSTYTSEAGVLEALGFLRFKSAEVAKLRDELRKDKQLVFKNREVMYKPTFSSITCKDDLDLELQSMYERGQGGMVVEQLKESYITIEEDIQALIDDKKAVLLEATVRRGQAKSEPGKIADKAVLFFRDVKYEVEVDKDFKEKWIGCQLAGKTAGEIKKILTAAKLPLMLTEVIDDGKKKRKKKRRRVRATGPGKLNVSGTT